MKLTDEEFCSRVNRVWVASVATSMKMDKNGEEVYKTKLELECDGKKVKKDIMWDTRIKTVEAMPVEVSGNRKVVQSMILKAVCGTTNVRLFKNGRRDNYLRRKTTQMFDKARRSMQRCQASASTEEKRKESRRKRGIKHAVKKLEESLRVLLKVKPTVNKGDVLRAFDKVKKHEMARAVMEE